MIEIENELANLNNAQSALVSSRFQEISFDMILNAGLADPDRALRMIDRHSIWLPAAEEAMLESGETDLDKLRLVGLNAMKKISDST